jgi:hypothetical protein
VETSASRLESVGRTARGLYDAFSYAAAGIAIAGGAAIEFSDQADVAAMKAAHGAGLTHDQMEEAKKSIIEISGATGDNKEVVGQAVQALASYGFTGQALGEILRRSSDMAVAGFDSQAVSAELLGHTMYAYGDSQKQAAADSNILYAAIQGTGKSISEVTPSWDRALSISGALHIPLTQSSAALETLTVGFGDASASGAQYVRLLNAIEQPTAQTEKAIKALAKSSGHDLTGDFSTAGIKAKGLSGVLDDLRTAVGKNTGEYDQLLTPLRGGNALTLLATTGYQSLTDAIKKNSNAAHDGDKVAQDAAEAQATFERQVRALGQQIENDLIPAGEKLLPVVERMLPAIKGVAGAIVSALDAFTRLPKGVQESIIAFGALQAVNKTLGSPLENTVGNLYGVVNVAKVVGAGIGGVIPMFTSGGTAAARLGTSAATIAPSFSTAADGANALTGASAAVAPAADAATASLAATGTAAAGAGTAAEGAGVGLTAAGAGGEAALAGGAGIASMFVGVGEILLIVAAIAGSFFLAWKYNFLGFRDTAKSIWAEVVDIFHTSVADVRQAWVTMTIAATDVRDELQYDWREVSEDAAQLWAKVSGYWQDGTEDISVVVGILSTYLHAAWDGITNWIQTEVAAIKTFLTNLGADFSAIPGPLGDAAREVIAIWDQITEHIQDAVATIKSDLASLGVSVGEELGSTAGPVIQYWGDAWAEAGEKIKASDAAAAAAAKNEAAYLAARHSKTNETTYLDDQKSESKRRNVGSADPDAGDGGGDGSLDTGSGGGKAGKGAKDAAASAKVYADKVQELATALAGLEQPLQQVMGKMVDDGKEAALAVDLETGALGKLSATEKAHLLLEAEVVDRAGWARDAMKSLGAETLRLNESIGAGAGATRAQTLAYQYASEGLIPLVKLTEGASAADRARVGAINAHITAENNAIRVAQAHIVALTKEEEVENALGSLRDRWYMALLPKQEQEIVTAAGGAKVWQDYTVAQRNAFSTAYLATTAKEAYDKAVQSAHDLAVETGEVGNAAEKAAVQLTGGASAWNQFSGAQQKALTSVEAIKIGLTEATTLATGLVTKAMDASEGVKTVTQTTEIAISSLLLKLNATGNEPWLAPLLAAARQAATTFDQIGDKKAIDKWELEVEDKLKTITNKMSGVYSVGDEAVQKWREENENALAAIAANQDTAAQTVVNTIEVAIRKTADLDAAAVSLTKFTNEFATLRHEMQLAEETNPLKNALLAMQQQDPKTGQYSAPAGMTASQQNDVAQFQAQLAQAQKLGQSITSVIDQAFSSAYEHGVKSFFTSLLTGFQQMLYTWGTDLLKSQFYGEMQKLLDKKIAGSGDKAQAALNSGKASVTADASAEAKILSTALTAAFTTGAKTLNTGITTGGTSLDTGLQTAINTASGAAASAIETAIGTGSSTGATAMGTAISTAAGVGGTALGTAITTSSGIGASAIGSAIVTAGTLVAAMIAAAMAGSSMATHATGGRASRGVPIVVGDGGNGSGAEIFVPDYSGTVIPGAGGTVGMTNVAGGRSTNIRVTNNFSGGTPREMRKGGAAVGADLARRLARESARN